MSTVKNTIFTNNGTVINIADGGVSPKEQLLYLAQLYGFQVKLYEFIIHMIFIVHNHNNVVVL